MQHLYHPAGNKKQMTSCLFTGICSWLTLESPSVVRLKTGIVPVMTSPKPCKKQNKNIYCHIKCLFLSLWTKGSSQYTAHMNKRLPHKDRRPTRSKIIWSMTKQTSCEDSNLCILERKQRINNITASGRLKQCNLKES